MYLPDDHKIWLATGEAPIYLEPGMANRHGLIAGCLLYTSPSPRD